MNTIHLSFDEFNTACTDALARLRARLPPDLTRDLKHSRVAGRHGTDSRFFQFNIWQRGQAGTLDKRHFNLSIVYDGDTRYHTQFRDRGLPHQLFCRFYVNKIRLYNRSREIHAYLCDVMRRTADALPGWEFDENEQMIALLHPTAPAPGKTAEALHAAFVPLLPLCWPAYRYVCALYTSDLSKEAVRELIRTRTHSGFTPARSKEDLTAYARTIPARLRAAVLERDHHRCRQCGATDDLHIDHIRPVSRGGLTVFENLQALCAPCNLRKSNRPA
jgi:hypothetical protein